MSHGLSDERIVPANGIELAYQEVGDAAAEPLLLIMGLGTQMVAWDDEFCALIAGRGFRAIRFDNRDIGHSTMLDALGVPSRLEMVMGRRSSARYLLADMARDAFALMDRLEIESAHVVGASMGGMIAQEMAIARPERVSSLVSIMSTTGNRWVGTPTFRAWGLLLSDFARDRESYVKQVEKTFKVIGSPAYQEPEHLAELAGEMYDRSHNPRGIIRQMHAISASGDRTPDLERLDLPATILHGENDPLARVAAGKATAKAIRDSRLRVFPGMGHDLPRALWPDFVEEIDAVAERSRERLTTNA